MKKPLAIVGLMSGTSMDGVDSVVEQITWSENKPVMTLLVGKTYPFKDTKLPDKLRSIPAGKDPDPSLDDLVAEEFAEAARKILKEADLTKEQIDLVASHGQTVWYIPRKKDEPGRLKILGAGNVIAKGTGIRTIYDFRTADLKAGGFAAPLAPLLHFYRFQPGSGVLNIGGISNITAIPKSGKLEEIIAFDTGPGNFLIDQTVRYFSKGKEVCDEHGKWSGQGRANKEIVDQLLKHPFFSLPIPKATDRSQFGEEFFQKLISLSEQKGLSPFDITATAVRLTAASVVHAYVRFIEKKCPLENLIVVGGGRLNPTLMRELTALLPSLNVMASERVGVNGDHLEAELMALLGFFTINGFPGNLPHITGASYPVVLGVVVDP